MKIGNPVYITDKFNVTIDCNVYRGKYPITFSWFLNNTLDQSRGNVSSITITVTNAEDVHGDGYTCKAENHRGSDSMNSTIFRLENEFCIAP